MTLQPNTERWCASIPTVRDQVGALRAATKGDFRFIYTLFMEESRRRHFNVETSSTFLKRFGFRLELKMIIRKQRRLMYKLSAKAFVYIVDNHPVGFIILSDHPDNKTTELWLVAITDKYKGKRYGTRMTALTLNYLSRFDSDIYARYHQNATPMTKILEKFNFTIKHHPDIPDLIFYFKPSVKNKGHYAME